MIIKNKTGRKNKTNLTITWPSAEFFTQKDLKTSNPDFVDITLRVKVKTELSNGKIKEIGVLHNGKGRPTNVYVLTPVNPAVIEKARISNIILHSEYATTMIANIDNNSTTNTPVSETVTAGVTTSVSNVA